MSEHTFTQRIRLLCPEGHTLGSIEAEAGDALMLDAPVVVIVAHGKAPRESSNDVLWVTPQHVCYSCPSCRRAGRRGPAVHQLKRGLFAAILAAQAVYGPASVSVSATPTQLASVPARLIPPGDLKREDRRRVFDALCRVYRVSAKGC